MVGDIFLVTFFMWIVAVCAFAPLGYFIYMYTMKSGEPFGDTEPHGDSESKVLDLAEMAIHKVQGLLGKK
ncbi:MAG: hypothetical protein H0A75_04640 [Candidatus Methanofishera endochildressiae]|jgi:hypothetical protein|uniref:Uncharacterized protein n=1 Tax=Candidatus Methanofishera endochildressiae TaxID=2738884 RepID=A0A7Z0MNL2_9GAMM|nr:hypothetical protein [Candidatus Methanofishera endochildressiae]